MVKQMAKTRKRRIQVNAGDRYGMFTVRKEVEPVEYPSGPARQVMCECECGNTKVVRLDQIRSGKVKSCGCLHDTLPVKHGHVNGGKRSLTYRSWSNIRRRCLNPNAHEYGEYGGRGIKMCERWDSFTAFIEDMGERPSKSHSVDRVNPDGDYEPSNCWWATPKEQARNRRNNRMLTHNGETLCLSEWADRTGMSLEVIRQRIKRGYTISEALTTPLGGKYYAR